MSARSSGTKVLPRSILAGWRTPGTAIPLRWAGRITAAPIWASTPVCRGTAGLLKHIGNLNWQQQQGKAHWNSNQTYLQRPIPQLNSIVSGGQIFTNGEFFDTIGLRGVNLSTDDNMFPDGMRSYAPEIRGVAQSNALVTVRRGSNIIYQTTVPPGPFTLQDVYPSGYGSDLEVSVKEADGSVEVFSVPYASVAQLLRPGMTRYALSAGKVDDSALRYKPMLYQATGSTGSTIC